MIVPFGSSWLSALVSTENTAVPEDGISKVVSPSISASRKSPLGSSATRRETVRLSFGPHPGPGGRHGDRHQTEGAGSVVRVNRAAVPSFTVPCESGEIVTCSG